MACGYYPFNPSEFFTPNYCSCHGHYPTPEANEPAPANPENPANGTPVLRGLQAQLTTGGTLAPGAAIPFNTVPVSDAPAITYFPSSGQFMVNEPGLYKIDYSVNLTSADAAAPVSLGVNLNGTTVASSDTVVATGKASGEALVNVTTVPSNISIANAGAAPVTYASDTPVIANAIVTYVG